MSYISIRVRCDPQLTDYFITALFELKFDSFEELSDGFRGSCEAQDFQQKNIDEIFAPFEGVHLEIKEEPKVNWNKEWEKNYDPIVIDDRCIVRATFHSPAPQYKYEIIVTPKMSFGTGHHATTALVLSYQMYLDHRHKRVLDVGTGTGILSIMAAKRGASAIVATDIDEWCIENSEENFSLNGVEKYQLFRTEIEELSDSEFDIIIANINKNVLLEQIRSYAFKLKPGGSLVLSGFYLQDVPELIAEGKKVSLWKKWEAVKDNWAMLVLSTS
ncbi:MAG: 50S ribosomal protein L11 methyltransferase [Bacteroidota bacterium]